MEFFRAGEALLRSSQPVLPFLAPAVYRSSLPCTRQLLRSQPIRSLATSRACQQQHGSSGQDDASSRPAQSPPSANMTPEFSQLLDSVLSQDKSTPAAPMNRASRPRNSNSEASPASRRDSSPPNQRAGAISELLDLFAKPSASSLESMEAKRRTSGPIDISAMLDPNRNIASPSGPPEPVIPAPPPFKLNSSVGRTIYVDATRNMDVAKAFRALEVQCARNKVRSDFMAQRFHERPGLKRKRLKRIRWRKRFKANFVATIEMVQRMKAQGW